MAAEAAPAQGSFRRKAVVSVSVIICFTGIAAAGLLFVPSLVASGLLAYSFGLRHAVDADHIAAIDNVTRRLTTGGRRPTTVGLFFALGHSTVVFLVCCVVAIAGDSVREALGDAAKIGGVVGALISGTFLLLIGLVNLRTALQLRQAWKEGCAVGGHDHPAVGLCTSCCPSLFNGIRHPWQMLPIGFLFGLGFDTSSEVSLLGIVAVSHGGVPAASVLLLPALFAGGMCLVDTLNGLLMAWAYGQALQDSMQRLYYNLFLTTLSAIVALAVGFAELLGGAAEGLQLHGSFWDAIASVNDHSEAIGWGVILTFFVSFAAAFLLFGRIFPGGRPMEDPAKVALLKYLQSERFIDRSGIDG